MQTIKTDPLTQDIIISGGDISIVKDIEAISEACRHAMLTLMDELVYNQGTGIGYFDLVFNDYVDIVGFRQQSIAAIENIYDVVEVRSFEAFIKENDLFYIAVIATTFGELVLNNAGN
jgi:hypothetical protein